MLDTKASKLGELVDEAAKRRDAHLERETERIDRRLGRGFLLTSNNSSQAVNHQHEWLSLMIPRLVFRSPKFKVQSARPQAQQETATAVRLFLNRWAKSIKLDRLLVPVAVDYSMFWGAAMVTPDLPPGSPGRRMAEDWIPRVTRIPPSRMIIDPHCDGLDTARFAGHVWVEDAGSLVEKAKEAKKNGDDSWNIGVLETLKDRDTGIDGLGQRFKRSVSRNEVVAYDLWVPEVVTDGMEPEDGFHGTIYTMVKGEEGFEEIRDPRPFWGPSWGPYTLFGCYPSHDEPWPLSPLAAVDYRETDLDIQYRAANKAAAEYKRVVLAPKGSKIPSAFDGQVFYMDGMDPKIAPFTVEVGGVTEQQLRNIMVMDQQLQRSSGMDTVQSGEVTGQGTATEVAIADSVTQTRAGFIIEQFAAGVERLARSAAWYAVKDDRVRLSLGSEGMEALGVEDPIFVGGEVPGENTPFEALELEIDPMSMTRSTEGLHQRRVLQFFEIVTQSAPMIMQTPMVNWSKLYGQIGDALNIPDAEEFVDVAMAMQLAGIGQAPQGGGGGVMGPAMGGGGSVVPAPEPRGPGLMGRATGSMASDAMKV